MEKKLHFVLRLKNEILRDLYRTDEFDEKQILDEYSAIGERLAPYIQGIFPIIQDALREDKNVLLEGAQGALLDLDFGTYPYVTSSSPTAGGALTRPGTPPRGGDMPIGVFKAPTARGGCGPAPTDRLGGEGGR